MLFKLSNERYFIEPRTRKYVKGYGFLSFSENIKKQLLDTGLDALETGSKKKSIKQFNFQEIKSQTEKLSQTAIKLKNKDPLKK